jgi:hypothetical protein
MMRNGLKCKICVWKRLGEKWSFWERRLYKFGKGGIYPLQSRAVYINESKRLDTAWMHACMSYGAVVRIAVLNQWS